MLMKHFLFYLIALTVCLPFASCSDEFVELPYVYDEISYRRGYDLDIPLNTITYIENQAEFDRLFANIDALLYNIDTLLYNMDRWLPGRFFDFFIFQ